MDWFKSGAGQVIALVTIVGTLAGFGYTGATYVNRIENLETKVVTITTTKSGLQEIEKRFEALETSLEYINKSLDSENTGLISKIDTNDESVSLLKSQLEGLSVAVRGLEKDVEKLEEGDKNPLAN
jgi:predicted PurR-regulated permease PerM|tara:strand:- start:107 stop:484 length:378 start_codon:yes stop_codon:yes gene_type:complete